MYTVITENDISKWDDETGLKYHFPSRYLKQLKSGTKVIYYKGRMIDKKFNKLRLSKDPHYFALAEIGNVSKQENTNNYYAEIVAFKMFTKAIPFKINDKSLEKIPPSQSRNYWRDGVRLIDKNTYDHILSLASIEVLNDQDETEFVSIVYTEGGSRRIYTTKYERKKKCRDQAIHIHGYTCQVCDLNFKEKYGDWGEGYIHVHHLKPLSTNEEEVEINPKTDLRVVCANCHSMIHRKKNVLLTIEELKIMINKKG